MRARACACVHVRESEMFWSSIGLRDYLDGLYSRLEKEEELEQGWGGPRAEREGGGGLAITSESVGYLICH